MVMLDIALEGTVRCRDGTGGKVSKLVVDPGAKHVMHLIIERGSHLSAVVVPAECMERAENGSLVLAMSIDDLAGLPHFTEIDYAVPAPTWLERHGYVPHATAIVQYAMSTTGERLAPAVAGLLLRGRTHGGISPLAVTVGCQTRVFYSDGYLGQLDHVLIEPRRGTVCALVVRTSHVLDRDIVVPVERIESVTEDDITLDADEALLRQLPEYRPSGPKSKMVQVAV
jgi:hypothetical protein